MSSEPILATPSRRERQFEHEQKESGASNFWPSFQLGLKSGCDFQAFGCPARCGFVAFVCGEVLVFERSSNKLRRNKQKEAGHYESNKDRCLYSFAFSFFLFHSSTKRHVISTSNQSSHPALHFFPSWKTIEDLELSNFSFCVCGSLFHAFSKIFAQSYRTPWQSCSIFQHW